jgi:hypothetical protein
VALARGALGESDVAGGERRPDQRAHDTQLALVFSAEAQTTVPDKRMFVRALVDGVVADPADVVFTEGTFGGARTFVFTDVVGPGIHTVEM